MTTGRTEHRSDPFAAATDAGRVHRLGLDGLPVPALRGRLHQVVIAPFAAAGALLAVRADHIRPTLAIAIFTGSVLAMLIASAAYHCHSGSYERKLVTRRLDHAMIFVAISGSQTAYWLLVAPPTVAIVAITVVWVVAAVGIHHKVNHLTLARTSGSWLYAVLGWTGVAMVPWLVATADPLVFGAVLAGGLVYSAGGALLVSQRVDPWPDVFGYHEVWHAMVLLGVAAHGAGLVRLTTSLG